MAWDRVLASYKSVSGLEVDDIVLLLASALSPNGRHRVVLDGLEEPPIEEADEQPKFLEGLMALH